MNQGLVDDHKKRMTLLGHEKMKKRKSMVEHPFGTMKRAINYGYTLLKGKRKVKGEFGLIALAYNMKRVISIRSEENKASKTKNIQNTTLFEQIMA